MSSEELIESISSFADLGGKDLSTSEIWEEYKNYIKTILKDPVSYEQYEALREATLGLRITITRGDDKGFLGFALAKISRAMIALRNKDIYTENIEIKFPEADKDKYIQLYTALEGIRRPFSHEEFHITYNNKDGSKLRISTDIGSVVWTKPNGELLMNTNLPYHTIRKCIKYFISGLYQPLEKFDWHKQNPKQ